MNAVQSNERLVFSIEVVKVSPAGTFKGVSVFNYKVFLRDVDDQLYDCHVRAATSLSAAKQMIQRANDRLWKLASDSNSENGTGFRKVAETELSSIQFTAPESDPTPLGSTPTDMEVVDDSSVKFAL